MAEEVGFVFDGEEAPIPELGSLNMDEAEVLYERCNLTLEDFVIDDEDPDQVAELAEKTKHPGFVTALLQIAYQRLKPGVNKKRALEVARSYSLTEAYEQIILSGLDEDPTTPQTSPNEATDESSAGSGSDSGADSTTNSDQPEETQPPTTTFE